MSKVGRPPKGEDKLIQFGVRLTKEDIERLRVLAARMTADDPSQPVKPGVIARHAILRHLERAEMRS